LDCCSKIEKKERKKSMERKRKDAGKESEK
jgi:hypothetical protein